MKRYKDSIVARSAVELASVLGLKKEDAIAMELRAWLNIKIVDLVKAKGITHAQLTAKAGASHTRMTAITMRAEFKVNGGRSSPFSGRCFTATELLVTLFILLILIAILLPAVLSARRHAAITICSSNLRQIGIVVESYRIDNHNAFPIAAFMPPPFDAPLDSSKTPIYESLKGYLSPHSGVYRCPADAGQVFDRCAAASAASLGVSYLYIIFPPDAPASSKDMIMWDYCGDSNHGVIVPFHKIGVNLLLRDGSVRFVPIDRK